MKHIETIIETNRAHIRFEIEFDGEPCIKTFTLSKQVPEYEGVVLSDYLTPEQINQLQGE